MKMPVALALCALALLQASSGSPVLAPVHPVSMVMPSAEERLAGARPSGGIGARAAPPAPPSHGSNSSVRIINGSKAVLGQFPWMLAIFIDDSFFCGGSIIAASWVLTAGHCVDGGKSFRATAGSLGSRKGDEPSRQTVTSTEAHRHPDYDAMFIDNDIALIKVASSFVFGEYVKAVRLPSYAMAADMMVGTTATISGWGKTTTWGTIVDDLMYVDLVVSDGSACHGFYGNVWIPNKLCFETTNFKSSCQGDSGGPLVIQEDDGEYTEIGLTSFGSGLGCESGLPVAFTRVASFLEFVSDTSGLEIRD